MTPRRRIVAAILVAVGALIYGISPIDVIPELLTGPIGLTDDLAVWVAAGVGIFKLLRGGKPGPVNPPA
jgi:uncharacterized membrane protein YkvA (DUF1232 family)